MNDETGQPQQETIERPDYVPEKFWDTERHEPNIEALGSSYKSLESKLGQRTEDLTKSIREDIVKEQKANVPDGDYELVTPDIHEGVEVNLEPDLPLVQWWGEFAREKGLSQNEFNSGVKAFVDNAVNTITSQEQQMQELGDNAKQRI